MVGDGEAREDRQTLIPHVEHGTHRLHEGDVERVQVLGAHGVVERQVAGVVVQQDADAAQVRGRLDRQLLAVVAHHPGVVAAAEHPGGGVLADPLVLRRRLVGDADSVPEDGRRGPLVTRESESAVSFFTQTRSPCAASDQSLPVVAPAVDVDVPHHAVAVLAGEAVLAVALLGRGFVALHRQVIVGHLQLLVSGFGVQLERLTYKNKV